MPDPTGVLVTGASGGLGRAACIALARPGMTIVGWGRNREALARTGAAVEATGGAFVGAVVDLSDRDALARAADDALERHQFSV
ncbi:SDR family NAD(P)-dependent oxidoreductase, partial [Rosenbergiella nectarea]|uniref:SDR family NAD(P)-dependent oxidoreductase n=1 Tax=Rosenbergiella nectarea TaxID=988801 RepID=UPI001F4EEB9E